MTRRKATPRKTTSRKTTPAKAAAPKTINVALQGGGAHGAVTWGVLDRLLEDDRIAIEGISGTSAGAVNAVALAYGLRRGGAAGARAKLAEVWRAPSRPMSSIRSTSIR
jgi:NTE family protein